MDRKISEKEQRSKKNRLYVKFGIISSIIVVLIVVLINVLQPKLSLSAIETNTVQVGSINVSIGAIGTIVPYYEEIITSPISSKILNVYKKSGEELKTGDAILELDLSSANVDMRAERNNVEIMKQRLYTNKANAMRKLKDLEIQIEIEEMKLKRMKVQVTNEHYLDSIGVSTKDMVRKSEMDYEVARLQLLQLKNSFEELDRTTELDNHVQELEYASAYEKLMIKEKQIGEARVIAPHNGTLSWVNDQIGVNVDAGTQLAILSDLSRFKVNAEVSQSYANKLSVGNTAEVKVGNKRLTGIVSNVIPAVEDGKIKFTVSLNQDNDESLRTGLKIDVYVVHSVIDDVMKIANKSYYSGPGSYDIWVIDNKIAEKRTVELGESSSTDVEVISGLQPDEVIILSNMARYKDKTKLRIK